MIKADHLVGQVIGDYRITCELPSQQGTQALYLGESEADPTKQVNVKIVSSRPLSSQREQEHFLQEASRFQQLKHPYILPLLDAGLTHDLPYTVTPYTHWRPLSTHMRRRWVALLTLPKTLLLLSQVGDALQYAHLHHIIHGQLTPRCILLDDQQKPVLTDFCFTSLTTEKTFTQISYPESRFYLAPEQYTGLHKRESDQYALACIAYELLAGRRAMQPAENAITAEKRMTSLVAPGQLNPAVPPALDQAILKALSIDPGQRFGSLREFLAALGAQVPEAIEIAPTSETIQPESVAMSSAAQAQSSPAMLPVAAQKVAAPSPLVIAHQQEQDQTHPQPETEQEKVIPDRPLPQEQVHTAPDLPTHEQQSASQQKQPVLPAAAVSHPRISEPGRQINASLLVGRSISFAPQLAVIAALRSRLKQGRSVRFARMAPPVLITVALLVVLSSGMTLGYMLGHSNGSVASTAQATARLTQARKRTALLHANATATSQEAHNDATATAQAQTVATAHGQGKPRLLWTFTTGGPIWSNPAVVNGVAYVGSNDFKLYAVNTANGQQQWAFPTEEKIVSLPVVVNGTVYLSSYDSRLYAIDATSGQQKWTYETASGVSGDVVVNGTVYLTSGDDNLYAIDATTGQWKWTFVAGGAIWSAPIVANGMVYFGSVDNKLYAIDAATGNEKWTFKTEDLIPLTPTVINGVVYVGSNDRILYALDAVSGQKKWSFTTGGPIWSSPAVVNGMVYVGSNDHILYAIDAATGQQRWTFPTGGDVWSSPAVDNGVVYVGSMDHKLYAIDATSGHEKWAFSTGDAIQYSSPTVVNGVVYIGSNDHKLYAIAISG